MITAAHVEDFDYSIPYALHCLGHAAMTLKPMQRVSVKSIYEGNDVFLWLPTGFGWQVVVLYSSTLMFDVKLGRLTNIIVT